LQALITLNETVFVECARALAHTVLESGGSTDADRVRSAFRRVLARIPTRAERKLLLDLLEAQRQRIAAGHWDPHELACGTNSESLTERRSGASPAEVAVYTVVCRVLLNLDETMTKE
jgi:hypothetical protein